MTAPWIRRSRTTNTRYNLRRIRPVSRIEGHRKRSVPSISHFIRRFAPLVFSLVDRPNILTPEMAKVEEEVTVGTLTVKLPTFWPEKPEAWFGQAEANFRVRRINSQKMQFNLVVVALDAQKNAYTLKLSNISQKYILYKNDQKKRLHLFFFFFLLLKTQPILRKNTPN